VLAQWRSIWRETRNFVDRFTPLEEPQP
jgi:hypothetical protein